MYLECCRCTRRHNQSWTSNNCAGRMRSSCSITSVTSFTVFLLLSLVFYFLSPPFLGLLLPLFFALSFFCCLFLLAHKWLVSDDETHLTLHSPGRVNIWLRWRERERESAKLIFSSLFQLWSVAQATDWKQIKFVRLAVSMFAQVIAVTMNVWVKRQPLVSYYMLLRVQKLIYTREYLREREREKKVTDVGTQPGEKR